MYLQINDQGAERLHGIALPCQNENYACSIITVNAPQLPALPEPGRNSPLQLIV